MDLELVGGVAAVGVIIGLVSLAKAIGFPSKFGGLLAVAFGLAISFGYTFYAETQWFTAAIIGLAVGLSAAGLYSTAKNAAE